MWKKELHLFFILIDNLRFDQWKAIQPIFAESFRILEEDSFYSILAYCYTILPQCHFCGIVAG